MLSHLLVRNYSNMIPSDYHGLYIVFHQKRMLPDFLCKGSVELDYSVPGKR